MSSKDLEQRRAYYAANREKIREQRRQQYAVNREKILAYNKRYHEQNRDAIRARMAEYRRENADEINRREREYYAAHRDRKQAHDRARYGQSRRMAYYFGRHDIRPEQLAAMWESQNGCCYLCGDLLPQGGGKNTVHLDHDHRCCPPGKSCPVCRRGLTCGHCNPLIGQARDDPRRLRRIADNLERALAAVTERLAQYEQEALFPIEEGA